MARKSANELSIAKPTQLGNLPEPPADLTELQAGLWHSVVATKPADWWDAANLPMLRALVVHESAAMVIDGELQAFEPEWLKTDEGVQRYEKLSKIRALHTGKVESLMTKMRLTQQARYDTQKAAVHNRKAGGKRPWDAN